MSYQRVARPKFYINYFEYISKFESYPAFYEPMGVYYKADLSRWRTLPVEPGLWGTAALDWLGQPAAVENGATNFPAITFQFVMLLGHNMKTRDAGIRITTGTGTGTATITPVVNGGSAGGDTNNHFFPDYNGFSLWSCSTTVNQFGLSTHSNTNTTGIDVGSIIVGSTYEMPHSPDLKLTMTREMDGVRRVRTKGGADLVDYRYTKPARWGNASAWELYSATPVNQELARSGRRIWDLSFSHLQDSDVFPDLSNVGHYGVYDSYDDSWAKTLLTDSNFFSQVVNRTNGGQIAFAFQPDKDDFTNFAICKLDMESFQFKQVANGVYNVKLKIREVW